MKQIILLIAIICLSSVVFGAFPSSGNTYYWSLDNTLTDCKSLDTLTNNGAEYTASGKINGAYFNEEGDSDYLSSSTHDHLDGLTSATISMWLYSDSLPNSYNTFLSSWKTHSDSNFVGFVENDQTLYGNFFNVDGNAAGGYFSTTLDNDIWTHIVFVYNGSNKVKLYKNGVLAETIAGINSFTGKALRSLSEGNYFRIGAQNGYSRYWDGLVDELGIWNRVLSADEISDLYNSGNGVTGCILPQNISFRGYNFFNKSQIPNLNLTVVNSSGTFRYSTTNGVITTAINIARQQNITLYSKDYVNSHTISVISPNYSLSYNKSFYQTALNVYSNVADVTVNVSYNGISNVSTYSGKSKVYYLNENNTYSIKLSKSGHILNTFTYSSSNGGAYLYNVYLMPNFTFSVMDEVSPSYNQPLQIIFNVNNVNFSYNDLNATLYYNNTLYTPLKTSSVSQVIFNTSVNVPTVLTPSTVNIIYALNYRGQYYNVSREQTILPLTMDVCDGKVGWTKVLNLSFIDEESLLPSGDTNANINLKLNHILNKTYGLSLSGSNNYSLCVNNITNDLILDLRMEYWGENYSNRKYYLANYELDNITDQINVYNIKNDTASDIILTVYDSSTSQIVPNAYVKILRYYPQESNKSSAGYYTVEIEKTDNNGETSAKMVLADVWYKFIVEYPAGTVRLNTDIQKILSTDISLGIRTSSNPLLKYDNLLKTSGDVSCTKSSKTCRFTWSSTTNVVQRGELKVYEFTGYTKRLIHSTYADSPAATLSYTIPTNTSGRRFIAEGWIYSED
jgi:hypothetical protein